MYGSMDHSWMYVLFDYVRLNWTKFSWHHFAVLNTSSFAASAMNWTVSSVKVSLFQFSSITKRVASDCQRWKNLVARMFWEEREDVSLRLSVTEMWMGLYAVFLGAANICPGLHFPSCSALVLNAHASLIWIFRNFFVLKLKFLTVL